MRNVRLWPAATWRQPLMRQSPPARRCALPDRSFWRAPFASVCCVARDRTNAVISCRNSQVFDVYLKATKGFLLACIACLWTAAAFAQAPQSTTTPPAPTQPATTTDLPLGISNFSSWKFERVGDHLHLINQAAIEGPNLKFFADDVDLYTNTNRIVASGNVVFTNSEGRISSEKLEFNTGTGVGTFYDASGIMSLGAAAGANAAAFGGQEPDVYFYGAKIEKLGPRKYRITNGGFTTCVQPTPRWEVTSG